MRNYMLTALSPYPAAFKPQEQEPLSCDLDVPGHDGRQFSYSRPSVSNYFMLVIWESK